MQLFHDVKQEVNSRDEDIESTFVLAAGARQLIDSAPVETVCGCIPGLESIQKIGFKYSVLETNTHVYYSTLCFVKQKNSHRVIVKSLSALLGSAWRQYF